MLSTGVTRKVIRKVGLDLTYVFLVRIKFVGGPHGSLHRAYPLEK